MSNIKLIDKGHNYVHREFEYTLPEATRSFWTNKYPVEGTIDAYMCGECGRVLLFGRPTEV